MSLDALDLPVVRTRGRVGKLPAVLDVRALEVGEVEAHTARETGEKATPLQRLSARHHDLARSLAMGMKPSEAAFKVGLSVSRVSILQADPTFKELVDRYKLDVEAAFMGMNERMAALGTDMVSTLEERLEADPDQFTTDELLRGTQIFADRTGHAPKRVEEKHHFINFGDRLSEARQRVKALAIETTYEDITDDE